MANFLSWNCYGFKNKRDEIRDIISDYQPTCFAFQETFLRNEDKVIVRDYNSFKKDFNHTGRATGGVALLVSNDFPHSPIPLNTNLQAITIRVHIHQLITVCTIYLPPNDNLQQHDLNPHGGKICTCLRHAFNLSAGFAYNFNE